MTKEERLKLQIAACKVRMGVIESTHGAKAGHPRGRPPAAYLYKRERRADPTNPKWEDRDRFVLSKGHTAPGLYSALAYRGFFPVEDLPTLRHIDSYLQGHPNMNTVPGVDMSTGSLGQGISCAAGMAKAAKYLHKDDVRVYALLGDGEIEEGEVWEAFLFAAKYKLDNLCVIIDLNGLQIDGPTAKVMNSEPLDQKMDAFGFNTIICNGNSLAPLRSSGYGESSFRHHQPLSFGIAVRKEFAHGLSLESGVNYTLLRSDVRMQYTSDDVAQKLHFIGVPLRFNWQFLERTKNPYKSMELAWIGDFNPVMNRMIETYVCATRHKVHTTYRYLFDRTKEFHRCPRLGVKRRSE